MILSLTAVWQMTDTLDAGVPVLSMHAPFETTSKLDCCMTYKGMRAVYEA